MKAFEEEEEEDTQNPRRPKFWFRDCNCKSLILSHAHLFCFLQIRYRPCRPKNHLYTNIFLSLKWLNINEVEVSL